MPKDSQPDPKHSECNKDSASATVVDKPHHTRNYHRAAGDGTLSKRNNP